jgi:hypothetical protein
VRISEALRQEQVERLAYNFLNRVAEHMLSALIEEEDAMIFADCNDGVNRGVEETRQALLAYAMASFGSFACSQFPTEEKKEQQHCRDSKNDVYFPDELSVGGQRIDNQVDHDHQPS